MDIKTQVNRRRNLVDVLPARALRILEPGLAQRTSTNADQKARIARAAAEFLPTEGIGVWQYSYAQWQEQSATA